MSKVEKPLPVEIQELVDNLRKENGNNKFIVIPCEEDAVMIAEIKAGAEHIRTWQIRKDPLAESGLSITPGQAKFFSSNNSNIS